MGDAYTPLKGSPGSQQGNKRVVCSLGTIAGNHKGSSSRSSATTSPSCLPTKQAPGITPPSIALPSSLTSNALGLQQPRCVRRHSALVLSDSQRNRIRAVAEGQQQCRHQSGKLTESFDSAAVASLQGFACCRSPLETDSHRGNKGGDGLRHNRHSAEDLLGMQHNRRQLEQSCAMYSLLGLEGSVTSPVNTDGTPAQPFDASLAGLTDSGGARSASTSLHVNGGRYGPVPSLPLPPLSPSSTTPQMAPTSGSFTFNTQGSASVGKGAASTSVNKHARVPTTPPGAAPSKARAAIPAFLQPGQPRPSPTNRGDRRKVGEQPSHEPTPPRRCPSPSRGRPRSPQQPLALATSGVDKDKDSLEDSDASDEKRVHFALRDADPTAATGSTGTVSNGAGATAAGGGGSRRARRGSESPQLRHENLLPVFLPNDELQLQPPTTTASPLEACARNGLASSTGETSSPASLAGAASTRSALEVSVRHDERRNVLLLAAHVPPSSGGATAVGSGAVPSSAPPPQSATVSTNADPSLALATSPQSPGAAYNPQMHPLRPALKRSQPYGSSTQPPTSRQKLGPALVELARRAVAGFVEGRRRGRAATAAAARTAQNITLASGAPPQRQDRGKRGLDAKTEQAVRVLFILVIVVGSALALLL